jgi:hydrogenase expression/formation protein HypC
MCLGIPGRVVEVLDGYAGQLALVDVQGATRRINLGMLEPDDQQVAAGEWVLIHMGFAIERIDQAGADRALEGLRLMGSGPDAS